MDSRLADSAAEFGMTAGQRTASKAQRDTAAAPASRPWLPSQLRAVILLGGTVRSSVFGAAIRRSLLDLPIGDGQTLLSYWGQEFAQVCTKLGLPKIMVRVVIGRNCVAPQRPFAAPGIELGIERDPVEFRGTGGVLRDLAQEYDDDDLLLVAVATQLSAEPLASRVERLWGGGDARLLAGPHREPTGLVLIRCGCLRGIATSGFVDLKEQALPAIAARHVVRAVSGGGSSHSVRKWNDYLAALRHRHRTPDEAEADAYQEDWQPLFRVVENGAHVDPTAGIHDSVVLEGARVEAKAIVVRCLVAPGAVVRRGQVIVGRLVTAQGESE
jgi:hypothetical protein